MNHNKNVKRNKTMNNELKNRKEEFLDLNVEFGEFEDLEEKNHNNRLQEKFNERQKKQQPIKLPDTR